MFTNLQLLLFQYLDLTLLHLFVATYTLERIGKFLIHATSIFVLQVLSKEKVLALLLVMTNDSHLTQKKSMLGPGEQDSIFK